MKKDLALCGAAAALVALPVWSAGNVFRVTPYVQHPATNAVTLMWLAQESGDASVSWWKVGGAATNEIASATAIAPTDRVANCRFTGDGVIKYCEAPELDYDCSPVSGDNAKERYGAWEMPYTRPWQYRVRLTGLEPGATYGYRVCLAGGATYAKTFKTAPKTWRTVRFVYYSDSETEPKDNAESTGKTTDWGFRDGSGKKYYATQTQCYASNIVHAVAFDPDLIVMAGDLAQKGSKQCDWDEFWRHNAGQLNDPAGSIPIVASPGNHDYWDYSDGGNTGIAKYLSYFEFAPNGTAAGERQQELFHRVDYGPVALIFIDANNGNDAVLSEDTSREMKRKSSARGPGCIAPDFNPGSVQYQWLETQLADAQRTKAFTFVVCHQCPYSCGAHGGEIGEPGSGKDTQTGRALRVLVPMFHKYGVDGWLCGHDEMMERSSVEGVEELPNGEKVPHVLQVWDMGIAGDGLRGGVLNPNPMERFRAGKDAPEQFDAAGTLVDGGRHYGHLEVEVAQGADGKWRATCSPTYVFVTTNAQGKACGFEKRTYDDVQTLVSTATDPSGDLPTVVLGAPTALPGTDFQGASIAVPYSVETGSGYGLEANLVVGGVPYAGMVDAERGNIVFSLDAGAAPAGAALAGEVIVSVNRSGAASVVAQTSVAWRQGLAARLVRTGWLDEAAATLGSTGGWTPSVPMTREGRIVLDGEEEGAYVLTPHETEPTNTVTVFETDVVFGGVCQVKEAPADAQAGICMVEAGDGPGTGFACLTASGWQTNVVSGLVVTGETNCRVRVEIAYTNAVPTVCYAVLAGTDFVTVASGAAHAVRARANAVALSGSGSVGRLRADYAYDGTDARLAAAGGARFADVASAIAAGAGPITLLWRASFRPTDEGGSFVLTNPELLEADWRGYAHKETAGASGTVISYSRKGKGGGIILYVAGLR